MNLDELKTAWKAYDSRLQSAQTLNEKIITSMIGERSDARFATVKKQYVLGLLWMAICLLAGCAVLLGNPFDYTLTIQYVPIGIYCGCMVFQLIVMMKFFYGLKSLSINHHNLDESLQKIIAVYERPQRFMKYILILFLFSSIILFPLSFLPHAINRIGLWPALAERLIPISISALLFLIARKLGAFEERNVKKFRQDLNELKEFRAMSEELRSPGTLN